MAREWPRWSRGTPPTGVWFLFHRGKRNSPKGRNSARCGAPSRRALRASRPTGTGGSGDPPLQHLRKITAGWKRGRGKPPYEMAVKHSVVEKRRAKPCKVRRAESSRPTGVTAHGDGRVRRPAPTTFQANHSRTETQEGQAPPLRDGGEAFRGGEPADGCRRVPLNCRGGPRPAED